MLFICLNFNGPYFLYAFCIGFSILFCAISKCASEGEKLSFTKDWIVVLAKREGAETLSSKFGTLSTDRSYVSREERDAYRYRPNFKRCCSYNNKLLFDSSWLPRSVCLLRLRQLNFLDVGLFFYLKSI